MKDAQDELGTAGPALRLLRAVETLAQHGPLTHEALTARLGISRSATWRVVQNLREAGWVRVRLGGGVIELDGRVPPALGAAHHSATDLDAVTDLLAETARQHPVYLDLVVLDAQGQLALHDTTRKRLDPASLVQGLDEACELAILAAMPSGERGALLSRMAEIGGLVFLNARYDDPHKALGPLHDEAAALPGYAWEAGTDRLVVSLRSEVGTPAAVRISTRTATARRTYLLDAFRDLRKTLSNSTQMFGKPGSAPRI